MRRIFLIVFPLSFFLFAVSCTNSPTLLSPENTGALEDSRLYVVASAPGTVDYLSLSDFTVHSGGFQSAALNTQIIAIRIKGTYAYLGSGYFGGFGSHDVKKIALADGLVHYSFDVGPGRNIPAEGLALENGFVYTIGYTSLADGILRDLNANTLSLNRSIALGGMPQAVVSRLGNIYIAGFNSYTYASNWVTVIKAGTSVAIPLVVADKNPHSLCLSDDGNTLFVLCAGTGAGDGSVSVITNAPVNPGFKTSVPLGFSTYGVIRMVNGKVYITSGSGLWRMDPVGYSFSKVALAGRGITDLQADDYYLYLTGGYDDAFNLNNRAYVLKQSDFSVVSSNAINYGMSALYH